MTAKGSLPAPLPMDQRRKARELWEAGTSYGDIESELGIKVSSLKSWRKRDGWCREKSESSQIVPATPDTDVPDLPTLAEKQEYFVEKTSESAVKLAAHMEKLDGEALVKNADKLHKAVATARSSLKLDKDKPACILNLAVLCGDAGPVRRSRPDDGRLRSSHNPAVLVEAEISEAPQQLAE